MGDEMRPEYDLRGGVRGKYFHVTSSTMPLIVVNTTSAFMLESPEPSEDAADLDRARSAEARAAARGEQPIPFVKPLSRWQQIIEYLKVLYR